MNQRELRESILYDVMDRISGELGEEVLALNWSVLDTLTESKVKGPRISRTEAMALLKKIGCKRPVNIEQFRRGIEVEQEHGPKLGKRTNVTKGDLDATARIALAHLKEIPDYYTRLERMEREAEAEHRNKKRKQKTEGMDEDVNKSIANAQKRKQLLNDVLNGKLAVDDPQAKSVVAGSLKRRVRGEERLIKRARRKVTKDRKRGFESVAKPGGLRDRLEGVSLGHDKNGYFVYTHRARSKSYEMPGKIPLKKIQFIRSTG